MQTNSEGVKIKEKGTGITRKIAVYIGDYTGKIDDYYKNECLVNDLQFFMYDKWKVAHQAETGMEIKDPLVKGTYKVVDVKLDIVKNIIDRFIGHRRFVQCAGINGCSKDIFH